MERLRFASATVAFAMLACTSERGPTDVSEPPSLAETNANPYTAVDLGHLGGNRAQALAINSVGQVVGSSSLPNGQTRAFRWVNGVMKNLGTLGGDYSQAFGINDHGHVVGVSTTSQGVNHAFLWKNGVMTDLGTIGERESQARDINNRGEIGGGADGLAILWKAGELTRLRRPSGATHCFAVEEISETGRAVGQCNVGDTPRAILWNGTRVRDLGTLGGDLASPTGINRWGTVVGVSRVTSGASHPFLWDDGKMIDLATRGAHPDLVPYAINDRRQIVGHFYDGVREHAAGWEKGKMIEISVADVDSYVWDINVSGQAVGQTIGVNRNRAVLWTRE